MSAAVPLTDLESIRKRPAMWIGSTDAGGLAQLIWEVVSNSLDQHLARRCTRIDVAFEPDGLVVVEDDGPGIPLIDVEGRPFAEVALTRLHATPTFDGHAPHEHVGLHGIGLFPVNALSSRLTLDVFRDGFHHTQRFARGVAVSPLTKVGTAIRTGTRLSFQPDAEIFPDPWFDAAMITTRLRELACLLPTLKLTFQDRREHVFHEPSGLCAFLERIRAGETPLAAPLCVDQRVGEIRVEAAMEWLPGCPSKVQSYANVARTTEGGTHVEGLVDGLARALKDVVFAWKDSTQKAASAAVRRGLHAVVCVRLVDPTYGAPTKNRLMTPEVKVAVSSVVRAAFVALLQQSPTLVAYFAEAARA